MSTALLRASALWEAASGRITATGRPTAPTIHVAQSPVPPGSALYSVILELLDNRVIVVDDQADAGGEGTVKIADDVEQRSLREPGAHLSLVLRQATAARNRRDARARIDAFLTARGPRWGYGDDDDPVGRAFDGDGRTTAILYVSDLRTALDL